MAKKKISGKAANKARLKKVQKKAKELKAKNPKLKHIDAVKKAWKLM